MSTVRRRGLQIDDPLSTAPTSHTGQSAAGVRGARTVRDSGEAGPGEHPSPTARSAGEGRGRLTTGERPRCRPSRRVPPPRHGAAGDSVSVWRAWSGITGVGSFRLPHELLVELGDTARELGLPIGMIVTAAITQLLDQPPEQIAELVDRADDARIHGRRNAQAAPHRTDRGVIGMPRACTGQPSVSAGRSGRPGGRPRRVADRRVPPTVGVRSPANSGPAPLQRPGPDTEGEVHSVLAHRNAHGAEQAPSRRARSAPATRSTCAWSADTSASTPPRQETSCPECGASARRSFALFRDLREVQR